jgi:hypothetical protein
MAALRDAGLRMSLSALQRNVIPDALLRWGVRKLLEGRLREITRPTLEAQMQELLAFVQCTSQCRLCLGYSRCWIRGHTERAL